MADGPFQISRQRYIDPRAPGVYCVGSRTECRFPIADGASFVRWTNQPARLAEIGALYLTPTPAELEQAELPRYVSALDDATILGLPAPLLEQLRVEQLPAKLVTLQVDLDRRFLADDLPRWPDALVLPQLRGLLFIGTDGSSGEWPKLGVAPRHVPGLEFLASDVDDEGQVIDALAGFVELRHLELGSIGDFDRIFERAAAGLHVVRLGGSGHGFSLAGIARLQRLVAVRLESIASEIDCALFRQLPELAELELLECRALVNVDALLECPRLRRVALVDCGGCLEGPRRQRFEAHGFEALNIGEPDARATG